MKIRLLILSLSLLCGLRAFSEQNEKSLISVEKKHDIRLSVSDALPLSLANFLGVGIADAITQTDRSDSKSSGMISIGYRYSIHRFRVGADFGFAKISSKLSFTGGTLSFSEKKTASLKERDLNFLVLPTGDFIYFKKGIVELYGSAGIGVIFSRTHISGLTPLGKQFAARYKSKVITDFAYQINPIALRLGNNRVGGFIETGLGYKGFISIGVSLKF